MSIETCRLCGSKNFEKVMDYSKSVFSDGRVSELPLKKFECCQCGLVQSSCVDITSYYENIYMPSRNSDTPVFTSGISKRSELVYEWMSSLLKDNSYDIQSESQVLEIGCGQGFLLKQFQTGVLHGIEPSRVACEKASKVASVRCIGYEGISCEEKYDLLISYCVLEHLDKPADFLDKINAVLNEDGYAVIALPVQDVQSYDLLFVDHLAHYELQHLLFLFKKSGLEVKDFNIGYKSFSNIGMFLLTKCKSYSVDNNFALKNSNIFYCDELIKKINSLSDNLENFFVFGAGEMSRVILPYTNLTRKKFYLIDDYNTGFNVIDTESSFKIIRESDDIINILVMVNPVHSKLIEIKYQDFKNVKLIFLSGHKNEME